MFCCTGVVCLSVLLSRATGQNYHDLCVVEILISDEHNMNMHTCIVVTRMSLFEAID